MDDAKCYLCRKHDYDLNHKCPGCGAVEPGFRVVTDFHGPRAVKQEQGYGYHRYKIIKGELGEVSKIKEEYEEFLDAYEQKNDVMALVELSDLLGAIEAYTLKRYDIDLDTLMTMTRATQRAFKLGLRK